MSRKSSPFYEITYETTIVGVFKQSSPHHFIIYPYLCDIHPNGYLVAKGRILADEQATAAKNSEISLKIAGLAAEIELQALTDRFTAGKIKQAKLYTDADRKLLEGVIKPFYDKHFTEIIRLLVENEIPLFKHTALPHLYEADQVIVEKLPAETNLKFTKTAEGTSYTLSASHNGNSIDLLQPDHAIITNQPCVLISGDNLISFDESINGKILGPFLKKNSIEIPKRIEKEYFSKFIRKMVNRCEIEAEGFKVNNLQLSPQAILTPSTDWQGKPILSLSFDYGEKNILPGNPSKSITTIKSDDSGFVFSRLKREMAQEKKFQKALQEMGLTHKAGAFYFKDETTLYTFIDWLKEHADSLSQAGFTIRQYPEKTFCLSKIHIESGIKTGLDWFDLNIKIETGKYSFPFIKLRQHILDGNREYMLPSGEIFLIPEAWMTEYADLMLFSEADAGKIRIRKHHYMLLKSFDFPEVEELVKMAHSTKAALPPLHNVTLRPYQESGYQQISALHHKGFGAILADDMGLGKTLQVIALLSDLYPRENNLNFEEFHIQKDSTPAVQLDLFADFTEATAPTIKKMAPASSTQTHAASLVVMPASLIHNWFYELKRFAPWLSIHVYTGTNRKLSQPMLKRINVILTTYGTLRNDIEKLEAFNFGMIVLDESQQIKNPSSVSTKAVLRITSKRRLAMSGTPIENRVADLWPQMQFVNPGMLGSLNAFHAEFGSTSHSNKQKNAFARLKNLITPFIIRRTKSEVAPELPQLSESIAWCTMNESQQLLYEQQKSAIRNTLLNQLGSDGSLTTSTVVLKALMRLRQISCHPTLAGFDTADESGKFEEVTRKLETLLIEGHKVLIFSSFVKHLELYEKWCSDRNVKYAKLIGSTTNREKVVNSFKKDEEIQIFLISLKAGGVGLNLAEAGYVFLLDPWWNPAAESQAINRAHRIGQDKNVFVYRFISTGTVEEKIIRLQQKKSQMADAIIENGNTMVNLSAEEVKELLA
ncbi:MAG: SNF2-related protein [Lentimicrobium sp.]|jgi:superfamily II DNA or RNA helicase|nr:SNF2-related protein [Lentimicrobium sp.]